MWNKTQFQTHGCRECIGGCQRGVVGEERREEGKGEVREERREEVGNGKKVTHSMGGKD